MKTEDLEMMLARAKEGKHTEFSLVRNYPSYKKLKAYLWACRVFIRVLHKVEKGLMKDYLKSLDSGHPETELILAYRRFCDYRKFYEKEFLIVKNMRAEYRAYLVGSGHFWQSVLSDFEREPDEFVDYRVAEWKLTL